MKILKKLKALLYRLRYRKRITIINQGNKLLNKAIEDREVDRIILKHEIVKYMAGYLQVKAKSKFIPKTRKNNEECRQQVIGVFGEQMDKLGISITNELELCTT